MRTQTVVGNLFNGLGQGAFRVTAKDTNCINTVTSASTPCNEVNVGYQTTSNVQIFRVNQNPTAGGLANVDPTLLTTIPPPAGSIGQVPNELSIVQDSRRVYVANGNSTVVNAANNSVSVIEGRTFITLITR
jgi:hypothetical protein